MVERLRVMLAFAALGNISCASRDQLDGAAQSQGTFIVDSSVDEIAGSASVTDPALGVVVGMVSMGSEGVLIADGADNTIWHGQGTGRPLRTIGRSGTGPGEFHRLARLVRCASGAIVAPDFGTKFVRYTTDGSLRSEVLTEMSAHRLVGCTDENALVLQIDLGGRVPESLGQHRLPSRFVLFNPDSGSERALGEYAGTTYFFSKRGPYYIDMPLAPKTLAAVGGSWLFVLETDKPVLHVTSLASGQRRALPVAIERLPLAPGMFQRAVDERLATIPVAETRRIVSPIRSELSEPKDLPYIDAVVARQSDVVWLRSFEGDPEGWRLWHAYAADGSPQGTLALPSALEVMEIGDAHVLGVLREETGDERVVRYRFRPRTP